MLVFALLLEHHAIPCTPCFPCADPGFSSGGGGGRCGAGQSDKKKALTTLFFFWSSAYFTEVKWLISKKAIIFQGSRGSPTFSGGGGGGGVQPFPGGIQLLIPYRNPYNFSRVSGPPDPPLDPHLLSRPAGDSFFHLVVFGWYFSVLFKF